MKIVGILLLHLSLEPGRMILKKWGKEQPLRDNLTTSVYNIVDGSALDYEVTVLEHE